LRRGEWIPLGTAGEHGEQGERDRNQTLHHSLLGNQSIHQCKVLTETGEKVKGDRTRLDICAGLPHYVLAAKEAFRSLEARLT
jgi:hypothetical protein